MVNAHPGTNLPAAGSVRPGAPARIIVVDDELNVARVLTSFFTRQGWEVATFNDPTAAVASPAVAEADVVLTDLSMPGMTGVEMMGQLRDRGCSAPVLVITAYGSIDSAVGALKEGAFDYLTKPFELDKVEEAVRRAYLQRQLDLSALPQPIPSSQSHLGGLIGGTECMQGVYAQIERAARSRANVLILGESGTGKELVARALHQRSARANRRFVGVSCAALPSELLESELFGHEKGAFTGANWQRIGRFELADGGTLFLDEIGDIDLSVQAKLMRVLQEREIDRVGGTKPVKVDVRLISATNRDLLEAIDKGSFREDLYYRLKVIEIRLPPLRDRRADIPVLAHHFLSQFSTRDGRAIAGFTSAALEAIEAHAWPGNVRELENAVECAVAMADDDCREIGAHHLPRHVLGMDPTQPVGWIRGRLPEALDATERSIVLDALNEHNWDLARTADSLGVTLRGLMHTVRKHRLSGHKRASPVIHS